MGKPILVFSGLISLVGLCFVSARGETIPVGPESDLRKIARTLEPGDQIALAAGIWTDKELHFDQLRGTAAAPIRIAAQSPGKTIISGASRFAVSGEHVIVSGIVFRNIDQVSDPVQFRTHSQRHAHHCRITDCVFEQTDGFNAQIECRWLSIYGTHNRVDHCYFAGKRTRGTTLVVWVDRKTSSHRIDHNHFGHRPELGRNGGETLRIGTSDVSELDSGTTVENNYFHRCDGEGEIVSNKACGNLYRNNLFDACSGALTLRHGHRCTVNGNVFLGHRQRGTGGVRIIGEDHSVINNYFEGLRGDAARAALSMMNGVRNSPLNQYAPVATATVAHNTFIDCKVSIELGVGAGKKQTEAPRDCLIANNVFIPGKWQLSRMHSEPVDFRWSGNLLAAGREPRDPPTELRQVELSFQRSDDGLMRPVNWNNMAVAAVASIHRDLDGAARRSPTVGGCDTPGKARISLPSPSNTGPTWHRENSITAP